MTQSHPKGPPSSRPPPALGSADGGRRVTALAAGGSVLLLSATAVALWPRTYGTAATFVLDGGAQIGNPVALAGRIEATLLEREELAGIAMELPPELRSPDPIGRLRAGIRVQSRGALGFSVEFRGSDPQSVQRITNRLVDRAAALVPKLSSPPVDPGPVLALEARTRAVTEFLTAHPEITLEPSGGKPGSASDSGLDALRTEKHLLEQHLAGAEPGAPTDNPYAEPAQDATLLNRRLVELKTTIARREAALKQPRPATPPAVSPELTSQWRTLLAELASAQAAASSGPTPQAAVTGHVTARAPLPSSPLTPNRFVLSIVAALLSMAAAMVAYVLPRKPEAVRRPSARPAATAPRSDPPPAPQTSSDAPSKRTDPGPGPGGSFRSDPPLPRSDPPPAKANGSEPPGPIAVQRTVVLGPSGSGSSAPPAAVVARRSRTSPGGMQAPSDIATGFADTALAAPPVARVSPPPSSPPAAPLFGSRPPPGAGSYSVSSSHPPPIGDGSGAAHRSVERLSPLQSARPPAQQPAPSRRSPPPVETVEAPQIVSRPPALDPDAEIWAARFETAPPPGAPETAPRKRSGRWKTQVMGSMVPIEVAAAREERPPASASDSFRPQAEVMPEVMPARTAPAVLHHDVPSGWRPMLDLETPEVSALRDAVLKQTSTRRLSVAVTGGAGQARARVAGALALALAQSGARVLLVEADFDRPELHQALAITAPPGAGFSQQLRARRNDGDPQPWTVVRCSPNLEVLVEGRLRSPGLLASGEFERAIHELKHEHHVIVMHAPALDKRSDLQSLSGLTQAVVVTSDDQPATIQFGEGALRALL